MDNPSVKKIKKEYVIAALLFIAVIAVAFVSFGTVPQYTYPLPDPIDTVLEIEYQ